VNKSMSDAMVARNVLSGALIHISFNQSIDLFILKILKLN
jgi:hypothetical protein